MTLATKVAGNRNRRRLFRPTLIWPIAVVFVLGLGLGWLANGARTQRLAVVEIRRRNNGGTVRYAEEVGSAPASTYQFGTTTTSPVPGRPSWAWAWLRQELDRDYFDTVVAVRISMPTAAKMAAVGKLRGLRVLELFNAQGLGDADWAALKDLDRLERLIILFPTTDAPLAYLAAMPRLRTLSLSLEHFRLDEAGFRRLGKLRQVERLFLRGDEFKDEWYSHLSGMDALRDLYLPGTTIGDEGLAHLRNLPSLKTVDLRATRVTKEGVAELKRRMPGLSVRFP